MVAETVASPSPTLWLRAAIIASATLASTYAYASAESACSRRVASSRPACMPGARSDTAVSDDAPFFVGIHPEDKAVAEIVEMLELEEGWDGRFALKPSANSAVDAVTFLRMTDAPSLFEPTLHADGSILLELDGGAGGVLKFRGDGTLSYAIAGSVPGRLLLSDASAIDHLTRLCS